MVDTAKRWTKQTAKMPRTNVTSPATLQSLQQLLYMLAVTAPSPPPHWLMRLRLRCQAVHLLVIDLQAGIDVLHKRDPRMGRWVSTCISWRAPGEAAEKQSGARR